MTVVAGALADEAHPVAMAESVAMAMRPWRSMDFLPVAEKADDGQRKTRKPEGRCHGRFCPLRTGRGLPSGVGMTSKSG